MNNKRLKTLADRFEPIMELVNTLVDAWSYDLSKRNPGIAYVDDQGNPITNLDMACFMAYLAQKRGVINVGHYKAALAKTHTEGEVTLASTDRHGKLNYLTSNQKLWSFGGNFDDANTVTADTVGAARTFNFQGYDGEWYEGWDVIEILPQGLGQEVFDAICDEQKKARFEYFIHPMRWVSVFGEDFRVAKYAADTRIPDRLQFLKMEIKRLQEELEIPKKEWPRKTTDKTAQRPKKFWAYESFIDGLPLTGEYAKLASTQQAYDEALDEKKRLEFLQKTLRFHVRASEYAWWNHMSKSVPALTGERTEDKYADPVLSRAPIEWVAQGGTDISKPVWAKDKVWQHGVKDPNKPKGTTLYASMEMEPGVTYRFRVMHSQKQIADK